MRRRVVGPVRRLDLALVVAAALGLLAASSGSAAPRPDQCLPYEPEVVSLVGTLQRHTFPGRPNYESVKRGDEAETGFYLHLDRPVCTVGTDEDSSWGHYRVDGAKVVQLVLDAAGYDRLRPRLGHRVTLRGTLFAAFTAHHHARLLLKVVP